MEGFLHDLFEKHTPTDTVNFTSNLLLILNEELTIQYPGQVVIEFTPTAESQNMGLVVAPKDELGERPTLLVTKRINQRTPAYGVSHPTSIWTGTLFIGYDAQQRETFWLFGTVAQSSWADPDTAYVRLKERYGSI